VYLLALGGTAEQTAEKVIASEKGTSGAKAVFKRMHLFAAVNRCATQNQVQHDFFRNREAMPFPKR
jgi:hypothetical protein